MQLFVKCPLVSLSGKICHGPVALEIDSTETIGEVKSMIHERGGLKPKHQQLTFLETVLEDERTLNSYNITNNCLLEDRSTFVFVIADQSLSKDILLNLPQTEHTVESIKTIIQEKEGLPIHRQKLLRNNVVLVQDNEIILSSSELCGGVQIVIVPDNRGPVRLYVCLNPSTQRTELSLNVEETHTILQLKCLILGQKSIPPGQQRLAFAGKHLKDDRTLADYNITKDSTLNLILRYRESMEICVKLGDKTISLDVKSSETIGTVRTKLLGKLKSLPLNMRCWNFNGRKMEDDHPLSHYNVCKGSILNLGPGFVVDVSTNSDVFKRVLPHGSTIANLKDAIRSEKQILPECQVLLQDGKVIDKMEECIPLDHPYDTKNYTLQVIKATVFNVFVADSKIAVSAQTTISSLKSMLEISNQDYLLFNGRKLDDSRSISDYNIQEGNFLSLEKPKPRSTDISVKFVNGRDLVVLQVDVYSDTVLSLKSRIQAKISGISPPCQQQLTYNDTTMEDSQTMRQCGIFPHKKHYVLLNVYAKHRMYIRMPVGTLIEVRILLEKKIFDLKCLIQKKTSIQVNKQQLYCGKVLEDTHTISSYDLPPDPMLQLCESQCLCEPLEEKVGSEGKLINWQQHGVQVTVPSGVIQSQHLILSLRVYNGLSNPCFEYPPECNPFTNVYEIAFSSKEGEPPPGVTIGLSNFRQRSNLCLLAASRNPSKCTADLAPIFSFSKVEGIMDASFAAGQVEVTLKTNGVYLFVADYNSRSKLHELKPCLLVEPVVPTTSSSPQPEGSFCSFPQVSFFNEPVSTSSHTSPHLQLDSSPEYKTMLQCTRQLNDVIALDPQRTCDEMMAVELIYSHTRDFVRHPLHTDRDKAAKLVDTVTDRVRANLAEFNRFLKVLKKLSWTVNVVQILQTTLLENC